MKTLPQSWCVKNDGSEDFKKVVEYLNSITKDPLPYHSEITVFPYFGVDYNGIDMVLQKPFGTLLTVAEFLELLPMSNVTEEAAPSVETETQEQFAVRFAEWMAKEGYFYSKICKGYKKKGTSSPRTKTTSELMEIFKQQKS